MQRRHGSAVLVSKFLGPLKAQWYQQSDYDILPGTSLV